MPCTKELNIHVSSTKRAPQEICGALIIIMYVRLVCLKALTKMHLLISQLGLNHLAVQASDVGDGLVLRADSLAGAGVGAVTKAELVHLGDHVLR